MTRKVAANCALGAGAVVVFVLVLIGVRHVVANVPLRPGVEGCQPLVTISDRQACFARRISEELSGSELQVARGLARIDRALPPQFAEDCHQAGHRIARSLSQRPRFDELRAAEAIADDAGAPCGTGVMHGLLTRAMASETGPVAAFADRYCASMPSDVAAGSCVHGIGHGLEATPARRDHAVDECTLLTFWISACVHGVMMQRGPENGDGLSPADCRVRGTYVPDERAAHICWRMVVPPGVTQTSSPVSGLNACVRAAPTASTRMACGANVSLPVSSVNSCAKVNDDIAAVVCAYSVFANTSKRAAPSALEGCAAQVRAGCSAGYGSWASAHGDAKPTTSDASATACAEVPRSLDAACRAGWQRCWPADPYATPTASCEALRKAAGLPAAPWLD